MIIPRRTVGRDVVVEGLGLHSGAPVTVTIRAAESGLWFRCGTERVAARPENVTETRLCTRLGGISTIEHLMSALAGLEITDADIELSAPEAPALDGSAAEWVTALSAGGFAALPEREAPDLFTRVFKHDDTGKLAVAAGSGHWRYDFHSADRFPFDELFETPNVVEDYAAEIAPARTFGWEREVEAILAQGLAKGLTRETAVVLGEREALTPLRFANEVSRHKTLDAIGDLYLAGIPIRLLNVVGTGSGHRLNVEAAAHLALATSGA